MARDRHFADQEQAGQLYSTKEVSELTDISHSTLLRWERRYPKLLSPRSTEGGQRQRGHRRYTAADIETVREIAYWRRERGKTFIGAARMIAEGRGRETDEPLWLAEKVLGDRRLRQAIGQLAALIRQRILSEFTR
jgi:DNA-binding transcriptional MerR regulator